MSEVLLIISGLIYSICFGIFMISWAQKDLYYTNSVFSYIPFISGIILPVVSYSIVLEWNWVIIFLIHIGFLFFLAKRLTDEYLVRFASGKGLGYDYILSFIIATFFMSFGLFTKYDLGVGEIIMASLAILGFISITIIAGGNKEVSKIGVPNTEYKGEKIIRRYNDLICYLDGIFDLKIIENLPDLVKIISISENNFEKIEIIICIKDEMLIIIYDSKNEYYGNRHFIRKYSLNQNQFSIYKDIAKLIINNDIKINIQHSEDPLKNFLKTDLQHHIQTIILGINLFAFGGKARLVHINENEFNLNSEGKYFANIKFINNDLIVHWTFIFNGEVYDFDISLGNVLALDEEQLLTQFSYLFIMTKEQLFKIIDEADDGSAYGISVIEDAAERDFL